MAKAKDLHSEMAHARKSDGINVVFDRNSPASSRSRSRSRSSSGTSRSSVSSRGRGSYRGRYRSSSSSSSSSRSSNSRSRSHPRCHRRFSCCRCENHRGYGSGRHRSSPSRRHRVRYHSDSCSPSPNRSSRHRNYRSRSRSSRHQNRYKRAETRSERRVSRSPSRSERSPSKSSGSSVTLSLDDKKDLLQAAKANAVKIVGTETVNLPESVKPLLSKQSESVWESPEPEIRVRQDPKKTPSQSDESDSEDMPSPKIPSKRKTISFSINNSVAKPTVAAPSCAKVTARADNYESRKPYGHWVPVKSGHRRKHTLAMSHERVIGMK